MISRQQNIKNVILTTWNETVVVIKSVLDGIKKTTTAVWNALNKLIKTDNRILKVSFQPHGTQ